MSFAETYSHEVLETRRIRAQRARFWAKGVSLLLMITIAATLRSEPQLRAALMEKGIEAVSALRGTEPPRATPQPQPFGLPQSDPEAVMKMLRQIEPGAMTAPVSRNTIAPAPAERRIKVNRPGTETGSGGPRFLRVTPDVPSETPTSQPAAPAPDISMEAMMEQIGTMLGGLARSN